jgi:hypothetical protein
MFNEPKYWCSICLEEEVPGQVDEVYHLFDNNTFVLKYTGDKKNCPGCDGTRISVRAQKERDKHNGR